MDFSDLKKLTQIQWKLVCHQLNPFDEKTRSQIASCSGSLANLFQASKTHCKSNSNGDEDYNNAMCEAITTLVCPHLFVQAMQRTVVKSNSEHDAVTANHILSHLNRKKVLACPAWTYPTRQSFLPFIGQFYALN